MTRRRCCGSMPASSAPPSRPDTRTNQHTTHVHHPDAARHRSAAGRDRHRRHHPRPPPAGPAGGSDPLRPRAGGRAARRRGGGGRRLPRSGHLAHRPRHGRRAPRPGVRAAPAERRPVRRAQHRDRFRARGLSGAARAVLPGRGQPPAPAFPVARLRGARRGAAGGGLALPGHRRDRPAAELHHRRRLLPAHAAGRELLRRRQPDAPRAGRPRPALRRADARRLRGLGLLAAGRGHGLRRPAPAARRLPVPPPPREHAVGGRAPAAGAAARPPRQARAPAAPAAPPGARSRRGAALRAVLAGAARDAPPARSGAGTGGAARPGRGARAAAGGAGVDGDRPSAAGAGLRRRRRAGPPARARPPPQPVLAGRGAAARRRGGGDGDRPGRGARRGGDRGAARRRRRRGRRHHAARPQPRRAVAREGHRMAGEPGLAEAAAEAAAHARVASRRGSRGGRRAGRRLPPPGRRGRGAPPRARAHRTALRPGWREDFRNWRDNVAERAYGFSGLGAVLPLLPEEGRRSFGFVLPLFALGGVERVVLRQAAALRGRGWRPHLFVLGEQRVVALRRRARGVRERQPALRHGRNGQRLEERPFRRRGRGLRQGRRGGGRARPARSHGRGAEHPQPARARADGAAPRHRDPHLLRPPSRGANALGQPARHRPHRAGLRARL